MAAIAAVLTLVTVIGGITWRSVADVSQERVWCDPNSSASRREIRQIRDDILRQRGVADAQVFECGDGSDESFVAATGQWGCDDLRSAFSRATGRRLSISARVPTSEHPGPGVVIGDKLVWLHCGLDAFSVVADRA